MKTLELNLEVSKDDVEEATPGDASRCPLAKAIQRHYLHTSGAAPLVCVGLRYVKLLMAGEAWIAEMSEKVSLKVVSYDAGKGMEPFALTLDFHKEDES